MVEVKTLHDVWVYLCETGRARDLSQYYCSDPNDIARAFWDGVLTVLELEHKITPKDANIIWNELINGWNA